MKPKEYRAALNGNSMKLALCATIDFCMTRAKNSGTVPRRNEKKYGYKMVWTSERKYITYILRGRDGTEKSACVTRVYLMKKISKGEHGT